MCLKHCLLLYLFFFFFKQKTAYEMRISDWSSDVCSSDLSQPLLHGYHVQTEGVRFRLDAKCLDTFVAAEMVRLENDAQARRWHAGQMLRFLVESKAQAEGVNAYEARRGAELMVSAAGEADLRKRLAHLLSFWSAQSLEELFEDTRAQLLSQHPLLGERRIKRVAQCLSGQRFQEVFK